MRIRRPIFAALLPWYVLCVPACITPGKSTTPPTVTDKKPAGVVQPLPLPSTEFASERSLTIGGRIPLSKAPSAGPIITDPDEFEEPYARNYPSPDANPVQLPNLPNDQRFDPPVVQAMRSYLNGKPESALDQLRTTANQDLLLQLIPAVTILSRNQVNRLEPTEASILASQLQSAARLVASQAPLHIEKAVFCRSVKNFGHYDPLPKDASFQPNEFAILYVELDNIPCIPTTQNGVEGYLTRLECSLQIRGANDRMLELTGKSGKVNDKLVETKSDFSRSPLKDYFLLVQFATPPKPGKYLVNFKVTDRESGREISKSVPFWVAGNNHQ